MNVGRNAEQISGADLSDSGGDRDDDQASVASEALSQNYIALKSCKSRVLTAYDDDFGV